MLELNTITVLSPSQTTDFKMINIMTKYITPKMTIISLSIGIITLLAGCSSDQKHNLDLIPTSFDNLPGWNQDHQLKALPALIHSCRAIEKKSDSAEMITKPDGSGKAKDWKPFCRILSDNHFQEDDQIRHFIESHLKLYQIALDGESKGTFTGYYIPILKGSRTRHGPYQTPLYKLPRKGINYKIPRSKIVAGALKGKGAEILWVDDPIEAFFVQIQGTGRVRLENGQEIRLSMAGQNGYPYFPIGKALIDRGILTSQTVSMQTIKKWLRENPKQAESIMSLNQSYVFFKETPWTGDVVGSQNVPLTAHRSMAVDREYISLGTPLWLVASSPTPGKHDLNQLMVAQDTGGAIKGAVRGDYYWGVGEQAAEAAGRMNSTGSLYLFLPRY